MSSAGPSHAEFSSDLPGPSLPGPSSSSGPGSRCHVATSLAIREAGNGSTNGSSDTPARPKKRKRKPETWKKNVAKVKRVRGEVYISPSTGKEVEARKTGPPCRCK